MSKTFPPPDSVETLVPNHHETPSARTARDSTKGEFTWCSSSVLDVFGTSNFNFDKFSGRKRAKQGPSLNFSLAPQLGPSPASTKEVIGDKGHRKWEYNRAGLLRTWFLKYLIPILWGIKTTGEAVCFYSNSPSMLRQSSPLLGAWISVKVTMLKLRCVWWNLSRD